MEAGGRLQGRADLHSKGDQTHTCDTANDSQTAEKKKVGGEFTPIELHPFFSKIRGICLGTKTQYVNV